MCPKIKNKNFKKSVDKIKRVWYNMFVSERYEELVLGKKLGGIDMLRRFYSLYSL